MAAAAEAREAGLLLSMDGSLRFFAASSAGCGPGGRPGGRGGTGPRRQGLGNRVPRPAVRFLRPRFLLCRPEAWLLRPRPGGGAEQQRGKHEQLDHEQAHQAAEHRDRQRVQELQAGPGSQDGRWQRCRGTLAESPVWR